jgi:hypothetical protein
MRNRLAWIAGAAGVGALAAYRALRRRPAEPIVDAGPDPRAEELRRKLDESRPLVEEREEFESAETRVDEAEPAPALDERRRSVHERGRAAADEMRWPRGS